MFNKDQNDETKELEKEIDLFQKELFENMSNSHNKTIINNMVNMLKISIHRMTQKGSVGYELTLLTHLKYIQLNIFNELLKSNKEINQVFDTLSTQNQELTNEIKQLNNKFDKLIELLSSKD